MANSLKTNPIYLDIFNADQTIAAKGTPLTIKKINCVSVADGDIFKLVDADDNVIVHITNKGAADNFEIDFGEGQKFNNGVILDVSLCTGMAAVDGTDAAWIYLK